MKITRNTTHYETREIRRVICRIHAHMKKLEGRPAPNWSGLRIVVQKSKRGPNSISGYAYHGGRGPRNKWDVFLGLPHWNCTEHDLGDLTYHELMHTYRYKHSEYSDIPKRELEALFPENNKLKTKPGAVEEIARAAKPKPKYGTFPIKIKMAAHSINEFSDAEYGSYEDWENADRDPEIHQVHTVEILERHKTVIEIRDLVELKEVYWAVNSGTFSIHCPGAAWRLESELKKHLNQAKKEAK